jgi:serine phosphatase RsbU (regulator of sigma subunit)
MPPPGDHQQPSGGRPNLTSATAGRQLSGLVKDRLANDQTWRTFTTDQRKWVCPWCLASIARRPQRSWEDSIGAHIEGCRHYGGGRFAPQPPASVMAQLSFENMVSRAETDAAWSVFDSQGAWVCPACLDRVPDARLVANQRSSLTFRGMALHLQRCPAYGAGTLNAAPVVRAAKDRPSGNGRQSSAMMAPVRTPISGAPVQPAGVRTPSGNAIVGARVAVPLPTARIASGLTPPQAIPTGPPPIAMPLAGTPPVAQPIALPLSRATPPQALPAAIPATGTHLRPRRFITPASLEVEPAAPPAADAESGFNWMDTADEAAGVVQADAADAHLERSDLLRARDLQQKLLADAPRIPGYTFATRYEPCDHVSGDFFSFIQLLDGRIAFAIGDVSGHGMQAGLVMSMAKKTLEIYGELIGDPAEVLAKVNDALAGDLGGKMFVSMTYAILSPAEREIRWVRAGHNPTLMVNQHSGEVSEIRPPGMVVGMKGGQTFRDSLKVETTRLRSGDTFLLYTDGITEMSNTQGEEFESERLREIVARYAVGGPEEMLTQIMDRVRHFRGTKPVGDDVTLLALAVE